MKKQALALIFANGLNFLVNFAMNPFLARRMSYQDNGTYGQLNLINGYITVFFGLGIVSIVNLVLAEYKGNEKSVLSANLWIQVISGLCCIFIIYFSCPAIAELFNNPLLNTYLVLYLPSTFFIILSSYYIYYYAHFNKIVSMSILTIVSNVVKVAGMLYTVNVLKSLYYTVIFLNILNVLIFCAHIFVLKREFLPLYKPDFKKMKYIVKLGYPYLGLSLIGYSILYVGGILISKMLGVKEFAIYRNGAIEIPFIATLYASITAVAMPTIVNYIKIGAFKELMLLKRKISNAVAGMIYPIVFFAIFNGYIFIELYLGNKYVESGIIFCIYNIAVLIRINSYADILTVKKMPKKIIIPNLISFVFNITLAYFLILFLGNTGAAVSYTLSILFLSVLLIYNSTKSISMNFKDYFDFPRLLKISVVCAVFSFLSTLIIKPNIISFFLVGLVYSIIVYYLLFIKLRLVERDLLPSRIQVALRKLKL